MFLKTFRSACLILSAVLSSQSLAVAHFNLKVNLVQPNESWVEETQDEINSRVHSRYAEVRTDVAQRTEWPEILSLLSADESAYVRAAVANNIHTPYEARMSLVDDSDVAVRLELADNDEFFEDVGLALVHDSSFEVRMSVASHPHITENVVEEFFSTETDGRVLKALFQLHRNIDLDSASYEDIVLVMQHEKNTRVLELLKAYLNSRLPF